MKLKFHSEKQEDYLGENPPFIVFSTPTIQARITKLEQSAGTLEERARLAFEIARDEVHHSFDTKDQAVSISAEDALRSCNGICFAKAHVLAALLRGMGIPAGFCYQRVLRKPDDPNSGFALHGLNAVWLEPYGWFRVDPRGNKPGVDSQFSPTEEKLAYPIRPELGEVDYPDVFSAPLPSVLRAMENADSTATLFSTRPAVL